MKFAVTTLGCPDWDIKTIARVMGECGIEGLEIRGIQGEMDNAKIPCLLPENWPDTKHLLDAVGGEIICLGTSCRFHEKESFDAMIEEGKGAIDTAQRIGVDSIRVFGDALPGNPEADEEVYARVISGFRILCNHARGTDVKVCHETHGNFNTIESLSRVLRGMKGVEEFGIIWDVMHPYRAYGREYKAVYALLKPYIHHLHIKDCLPDHTLVPCGEGDIPLKEIVETLKADGYDGYLSLEWEKVWHPELAPAEEIFPAFADYFQKLL